MSISPLPLSVQHSAHEIFGGAERHLRPSAAIYLLLPQAFPPATLRFHHFSTISRYPLRLSMGVSWHLNNSPRCNRNLSEGRLGAGR